MRVGSDRCEKTDQVRDVVVKTKMAMLERHVACIVPIGNEDVVLRQHRTHGCAQQRCEMPGQRSDQQDTRLSGYRLFLEMQQCTERRCVDRLPGNRYLLTIDRDDIDSVRRT